MKYVFSAIGGSGTTFLINALKKSYKVDEKPDTFFVGEGEPHTPKKPPVHQFVRSLDDKPAKFARRAFRGRTGFAMDKAKTIEANMLDYVRHVQDDPRKTAVFNALAKWQFFSRNGIHNYVCVVRHPLQAFLSFTKEIRHAKLMEQYGGRSTNAAVDYYARGWNSVVSEFVKLRPHSHYLRYEYLPEDAKSIGLNFPGWKPHVNKVDIPANLAVRLREKVKDNFDQVYPSWEMEY